MPYLHGLVWHRVPDAQHSSPAAAQNGPAPTLAVLPRQSHAPPMQVSPPAQLAPHAPQLVTSVLTDRSQPFARLPSQSAKPALHAA